MEIRLEPHLARFIDEQVKRGIYDSAEDAVNAGVARLQTEEELSAADIEDLRAELDAGIAEADAGEFTQFTAEDIIAERRARRP